MTEVTTEVTLPESFKAQLDEAHETAPIAVDKPKTKTILWHGRAWQIRHKAGANFLAEYEVQHLMGAAKTVLGEKQYAELVALDVDAEGDDGLDGFFKACNKAWGLAEGN